MGKRRNPYWINTCIETLNEENVPKLKKQMYWNWNWYGTGSEC